ncbi:hypothetical protein JCM10212_001164 [Sporobolomyces blumeae]
MKMTAPHIEIATLGLFILDTFEWRTASSSSSTTSASSPVVIKRDEGVIGGGGTYAIMGARIWLPPRRVGILVDRGKDWDPAIEAKLGGYGNDMWVYRDKQGETTKALNLYTGEHREFKYLTERTRLEPRDLPAPFRRSRFLHFVCSPTRAATIRAQLLDARENPTPTWQPDLVYEPIPDRCVPEELDALRNVLPDVRIFSPNHEEAGSFFGIAPDETARRGPRGVEEVAKRFIDEGAKDVVVIRSGAWGAYVLRRGRDPGFWVPAYYPYDDREAQVKVVDVTGAGNSFLGGLMAGLVLYPDDLEKAVQCASVSASFIIEQFGLPLVSTDAAGVELWNGSSPSARLEQLRGRVRRK